MVIWNVDPFPSSDSTQIRPPYRSAIRWQIARPIPVPGNRSLVCSRLEDPEDLFVEFLLDPQPVIRNRETPVPTLRPCGNMNAWRLFPPVFDRIPDQILKQLLQVSKPSS